MTEVRGSSAPDGARATGPIARLIVSLIVVAIVLDIVGRRRSAHWTLQSRTPPVDALSSVTVLNIWDIAFVKETTC